MCFIPRGDPTPSTAAGSQETLIRVWSVSKEVTRAVCSLQRQAGPERLPGSSDHRTSGRQSHRHEPRWTDSQVPLSPCDEYQRHYYLVTTPGNGTHASGLQASSLSIKAPQVLHRRLLSREPCHRPEPLLLVESTDQRPAAPVGLVEAALGGRPAQTGQSLAEHALPCEV